MLGKLRKTVLVAVAAAIVAVPAVPAPALAQPGDDCDFYRPTVAEAMACVRYILRNFNY